MRISLLFAVICSSLSVFAEVGPAEIAGLLEVADCYAAQAKYEVILPGASDPVTYRLKLMSHPAPGDSLSPCNYLIEWGFSTPDGDTVSEGFSAYFSGNYFRFRNGKLSEYHVADDPVPFAPRGKAAGGVQMNDQFAPLLPVFLAGRMRAMEGDTACVYTVERRGDEIVVKGRESRGGYVADEFSYRFDSATMMPVSWEMITNPGQLGEQTITAEYSGGTAECEDINEQTLTGRFPSQFAKYRRDSFALENLRGEPLPGFTAPTPTRERYSRRRGDSFASPTIIAVLDTKVDATGEVIGTLRSALASLPSTCDLIIAFTDNDLDAAGELTGALHPGETVLVSARELAAECGVADTPSIIFCRPDGTVSDVHVGRNKDLRDIVIQKAAMIR